MRRAESPSPLHAGDACLGHPMREAGRPGMMGSVTVPAHREQVSMFACETTSQDSRPTWAECPRAGMCTSCTGQWAELSGIWRRPETLEVIG